MDNCISYLFSAEVQLLSADLLLADRQLADISRPQWPILVGPSGRVADAILGLGCSRGRIRVRRIRVKTVCWSKLLG